MAATLQVWVDAAAPGREGPAADPISEWVLQEVGKVGGDRVAVKHARDQDGGGFVELQQRHAEQGAFFPASFPATVVLDARGSPVKLQRPGCEDTHALYGQLDAAEMQQLLDLAHRCLDDQRFGREAADPALLCDFLS